VLLSLPGTGRVAALYTSDPDYDSLANDVVAFGTPPAAADDADVPAGLESRPSVTLSWLIHDISVWRVDRVFLPATVDGDVWISTQTDMDGTGDLSDAPVLHKSPNGQALTTLLTKLGLNPAGPTPQQAPAAGGVAAPAVPRAAAPAPAAEGRDAGPAWVWAIAGLVGGVVLTVAGEQLWSRRSRRPDDAEVDELVDLERV
jgi:hypothetical protein